MTTANKRKRSDAAFAEIERPFASLRAHSTQNGAGESKRPLTAACIACRKQKVEPTSRHSRVNCEADVMSRLNAICPQMFRLAYDASGAALIVFCICLQKGRAEI